LRAVLSSFLVILGSWQWSHVFLEPITLFRGRKEVEETRTKEGRKEGRKAEWSGDDGDDGGDGDDDG
jgi:hypothetical protein